MEMQIKNIYYITTGALPERQESGKPRHRFRFLKKENMLPVYKCSRSYLYAGGRPSAAGNPAATGGVEIYFSILPENIETELKKAHRRKKWLGRLAAAMDYAEEVLGCTGADDILFSERLCRMFEKQQTMPFELYGVLLWTGRKQGGFWKLNITLPEDCGFIVSESIISLLEPYLARVNTVTFSGKETEGTLVLEDYLYNEYGIVADYGKDGNGDTVRLNFADGKEILKLLDTTVKSGYNTKVN